MRRYVANYLCLIILNVFLIMASVELPASSRSIAHAMEEDKPYDLDEAVNRVVKEKGPAVVHIEVLRRKKSIFPFWFYEMAQLIGRHEKAPYEKPNWQNRGTGVLIDEQGHILTNYHIVGEATDLQVLQTDSRRFPASLLGADPETDLAVIRLRVHQPVTYMTFGDSDKLRLGEPVVTIGYGTDRNRAVERGIITARPEPGITDFHALHDLIRVDIPVHPDNTGGPLFDLRGKIVGINSVLMTRFIGLEGTGFAIPGNVAIRVARKLIKNGTMDRGWLGVTVQDISPYKAGSVGLGREVGALVAHVVRGGPADRAGLKPGDVLTDYRDQEVMSAEHLQREVARSPIGEKVSLAVVRNKGRLRVSVVIGNLEEAIRDPAFFIRNRLGVDVRSVTPKEADQYGLDSRQGLVIIGFYPGSPLGDVGFELNDMIMEVEGRPVKGPTHFMDQIINLRQRQRVIMLGLDHRTGRSGFVQVEVP